MQRHGGQVWKALRASKRALKAKLLPGVCWGPETRLWGTFCSTLLHLQHLAPGLALHSPVEFHPKQGFPWVISRNCPSEGEAVTADRALCAWCPFMCRLVGIPAQAGGRARLGQGTAALAWDKGLFWPGRCSWELHLKLEAVTRCDCSVVSDPVVKRRWKCCFLHGDSNFPQLRSITSLQDVWKGDNETHL